MGYNLKCVSVANVINWDVNEWIEEYAQYENNETINQAIQEDYRLSFCNSEVILSKGN